MIIRKYYLVDMDKSENGKLFILFKPSSSELNRENWVAVTDNSKITVDEVFFFETLEDALSYKYFYHDDCINVYPYIFNDKGTFEIFFEPIGTLSDVLDI